MLSCVHVELKGCMNAISMVSTIQIIQSQINVCMVQKEKRYVCWLVFFHVTVSMDNLNRYYCERKFVGNNNVGRLGIL